MLTRDEGKFSVIPAVDVLGDAAVRLRRGEYESVVNRHDDPLALVEMYVRSGASAIHLVDLDGARNGRTRPEVVRNAVQAAAPVQIQASGGIRSISDAETLLEAGATRIVLGTAAFASVDALTGYVDALGERLVVAVDVRDGVVAVGGWLHATNVTVEEAIERCRSAGVARILCTAIDRDGTLGGPDLALLERVARHDELSVLAAGGVGSVDDLEAIARTGCEGAVVGRALLEGRVPLDVLA